MRAKIASHITISAKLLVGVAVLSRPTPPTTAKPPRRVVLARGYLQVGIGDPKLSILFAWKMQYALTLTVVPFEIPPATHRHPRLGRPLGPQCEFHHSTLVFLCRRHAAPVKNEQR
jgi:hypothetical protein